MTSPTSAPGQGGGPRLKVCRVHRSGVLLDVPFTPPASSQLRVGTFWPEPRSPTGWVHDEWTPGPNERGFTVPHVIELADVVGFAAFATSPPPAVGARDPWRPPDQSELPPPPEPKTLAEWWGYVHALEDNRLILHGPYPDTAAAYIGAQAALLTHINPPPPRPGRPTDPQETSADLEPAQPPLAVIVRWDGRHATVGDPDHGWLHVDADDLAAGLAQSPELLAVQLRRAVALTGREAPITLATLAAIHLPHRLPDITSPRRPPAPTLPAAPTPAPPPPVPPIPHADAPASSASAAAAGPTPSGETSGPATEPVSPAEPEAPASPPAAAGPDLPGMP